MNFKTIYVQIFCVLLHLFLLAEIVVKSLSGTDGILVMSLDDPYIHLTLADSILNGGFGINPGEYASASSSIIYPYLLALGLSLNLGMLAPFAVSSLFSIFAIWVFTGFVVREMKLTSAPKDVAFISMLAISAILCFNLLALPMMGMEHTIHIWATILCLTSFYRYAMKEEDKQLFPLILGTMMCVIVRFEGVALALAVVVALMLLNRRNALFLTVVSIAIPITLYLIKTNSLDLPVLPSSVTLKSNIAYGVTNVNQPNILFFLKENILNSLLERWGVIFFLSSMLFGFLIFELNMRRNAKIFFGVLSFFLISHVLAGRYDGYDRYEVYAVSGMIVGYLAFIKEYSCDKLFFVRALCFFSIMVVLSVPYIISAMITPAASRNIYQQQYQMARFSKEYFPYSVGVNDLGLVGYKNDNYILDLWGLGSEEVRKMRNDGIYTSDAIRRITKKHQIQYTMIYDEWYPNRPSEWCLAGRLKTSKVSSAYGNVSIYLLNQNFAEEIQSALANFSETLPQGSELTVYDCSTKVS